MPFTSQNQPDGVGLPPNHGGLVRWLAHWPGRALAIAVGIAVVAMAGVWTYQQDQSTGRVDLYAGIPLSDIEIHQIQIALSKSQLNEFEVAGGVVSVPRKDRDKYIAALAEHGAVPTRLSAGPTSRTGFNPWLTRRDRQQIEQQQRVERIVGLLSQLEFVEQAWVEFDEVQSRGLKPQTLRTAMVVVRKRGRHYLNDIEITTVRQMVQGAVAGLESNQIVVTDLNAGVPYSHENCPSQLAVHSQISQQIARNRLHQSLRREFGNSPGVTFRVVVADRGNLNSANLPAEARVTSTQPAPKLASHRTTAGTTVSSEHANDDLPLIPGANRSYVVRPRNTTRENDDDQSSLAVETTRHQAASSQTTAKVLLDVIVEMPTQIRETAVQTESSDFENRVRAIARELNIDVDEVVVAKTINGPVLAPKTEESNPAIDHVSLKRWLKKNGLTVVGIGIGLSVLLVVMRWQPGPPGSQPSQPPNGNGFESGSATEASRSHRQAPERADGHAARKQSRQSTQRLPMQAEIAALIRDNPHRAAEVLQDWVKDAA